MSTHKMYSNRDVTYGIPENFREVVRITDIKKGDVFLDLGANVGQEIEFFGALGVNMHSYEPHPFNFGILEEKYKHTKNVELYNKAVWVDNCQRMLYFKYPASTQKIDEGATLIFGKTSNCNEAHMVDCIDICDVVNKLENIKILKIDVEGAEYHLLKRLIEKDLILKPEFIFAEDHSRKMTNKEFSENQKFVQNFAIENKIKIFRW